MTAAVQQAEPVVEDTDEFDIKALIAAVIDTSGLTDPGEIAFAVDRQVSDENLRDALRSLLRNAARDVLMSRRTRPVPTGSGSGRATQVREWYTRTLQISLHVGDDAGSPVWAQFGDCTTAELDFVIAERREMARRNAAQANVYERVQARMRKAKAKRVRDLPVDDLHEAMQS